MNQIIKTPTTQTHRIIVTDLTCFLITEILLRKLYINYNPCVINNID